MSEIEDLRKDMSRIELKVEQVLIKLEPISRLYRGNGKPSLDVRVSVVENDIEDVKGTSQWASRTAVGALITTAGTALWYILTQ